MEGLREHKAAILEALEGREKPPPNFGEVSEEPAQNFASAKPGQNSDPVIESTGEVLELARAHLGEMAQSEEAPYPPPEKGTDPLVHRHTAKARFFRGVRRRDLGKRECEGLPPWIRIVDGGGDAA